MNRLAISSALALWIVGFAGLVRAAENAPAPPRKINVAVLDFAGQNERLGKQLADSVHLQLARHEPYEVLDQLSTSDAVSAPLSAAADQKTVIELMTAKLRVAMALYGTVTRSGESVSAEVCCIDLTDPSKPANWTRTFSDDTERARGLIAGKIVEEVRARSAWRPPEYGDEEEPGNFGKPLNVNGGFESGRAGWAAPDNATTFIEAGPARHGKVLRIQTDLERDKWLEYQRDIRLGRADPNKPPKLEKNTSRPLTPPGSRPPGEPNQISYFLIANRQAV